jgi:hypothetical protein
LVIKKKKNNNKKTKRIPFHLEAALLDATSILLSFTNSLIVDDSDRISNNNGSIYTKNTNHPQFEPPQQSQYPHPKMNPNY